MQLLTHPANKNLISIQQQHSVCMYATVYSPPPAPQPELDHLTTVSCYFPESLHRGPFKGAQWALFGVINKTLVLDKKRMDALWNVLQLALGCARYTSRARTPHLSSSRPRSRGHHGTAGHGGAEVWEEGGEAHCCPLASLWRAAVSIVHQRRLMFYTTCHSWSLKIGSVKLSAEWWWGNKR